MHSAIHVIREEHRSIGAVMHGLQTLARLAENPQVKPRFEVFRAMIYYIDAFPERMHHPKEDRDLFARLERRAPQAAALIHSLKEEHEKGAQLVRDLEQKLLAFEQSWPKGAAAFAAAVEQYAQFHWEHMRKEEELLMPLAEKMLHEEDWQAIDASFAGNRDPIADLREQDFDRLFARIVEIAPEPIGLGERWKPPAA